MSARPTDLRVTLSNSARSKWSTFPSMLWGNFAQTAVQPLPARDDLDLQEHAAILEALSRHDAEAAARQMERHIRQAGEELATVLQTSRARVQA
jgi:DNA-binding GntR family transcriptional regulator